MCKPTIFATCLILGLQCVADEVKQPYIIKRGDNVIEVYKMPTFTASEPISNSFVYINGEYISSPYVVSVTNLTVYINGHIIENYDSLVNDPKSITPGRRFGNLPNSIAQSIDNQCESLVKRLTTGRVLQFYGGGRSNSGMDDGSGALARIELARKAVKGDEQAKQTLIQQMNLKDSLSHVHPDWIERLANNTNLETRAKAILEVKRERERLERERREQMNKQEGKAK